MMIKSVILTLLLIFVGSLSAVPLSGVPAKPGTKAASCLAGWSWAPIREQCIRVQDTKMTEPAAEQDCQQYGGHLVSILNAFEHAEIINISKIVGHCDYYWIGAKKSGKGPYSWTDGRPFGFTDFGPGVDGDPQFDCVDVRLGSTRWHTYDCNNLNCFICERPDGTGPSTQDTDCNDLKNQGVTQSGVYDITLNGQTYSVYCDMDTEKGGWTVIQQRVDGGLSFWDQKWDSYKAGFGTPGAATNFWAGNELIHQLTSKDDKVVLRVDLWGDRDPNSNHVDDYWWGEYYMKVDDEPAAYALHIQIKFANPGNPNDYSTVGNASTAWYDITCSDGIKFSTVDRINDPMKECVTDYHLSGWWLHYCGTASLNGQYVPPVAYGDGYGFVWMVDGYFQINPKQSRMSLRVEKTATEKVKKNEH